MSAGISRLMILPNIVAMEPPVHAAGSQPALRSRHLFSSLPFVSFSRHSRIFGGPLHEVFGERVGGLSERFHRAWRVRLRSAIEIEHALRKELAPVGVE